MKKITFLSLLLVGLFTQAQVITHSTSVTVDNKNIACNTTADGTSNDNKYYRAFDLNAFSITGDYTISSVEFGVTSLTIPSMPAGFPVTVNVYKTPSNGFPSFFPGNYTLVATANRIILPADVGNIVSVPITALIPAGEKLVVEVGYAAAVANSTNQIFLSANNLGETAPSFLSSVKCGITEPVTMASINFPDVHFVLQVTGAVLSTQNYELDSKISVFPNPSNGIFSLKMPASIMVEKATLTDVTGKQIDVNMDGNNSFNITAVNAGVYFLNVQTNEGSITKKIVKE